MNPEACPDPKRREGEGTEDWLIGKDTEYEPEYQSEEEYILGQ